MKLNQIKWINVDDCKTSLSGPFHNSTHCKQSCDNYYIFSNLECHNSCSTNDPNNPLYLDEATGACFENCPSSLGRGFLNSEKTKCRSCNIPKATNPNMTEEGYYKSGEKICYDSCSRLNSGTDIYYHNNGENICFKGGCGNVYKYEKDGSDSNSKICYKSCLDIPDSYTIEINNVCYQQLPTAYSSYYYYVLSTGIKKYFHANNAFNECSQQLLYYVKNKQCIKQCDTNDYIILPTDQNLGECYSSLNDLPAGTQYKFYNKTKILKKECELLTIMGSNNAPKVVDEANCVTECPNGYYEYVSEKICKEAYVNSYYVIEESNRKKCISETDCKKYKYVPPNTAADQEKKCVDKCTYKNEGNIFSYYNSNNFCLDDCSQNTDTNNRFSYKTTNDHLQCISGCPSGSYYYEDKKICLNDCGEDYYSKGNNQICTKNCGDGEFIHPGNICTDDFCPSSAPFYYELPIGNSGFKVKKCVPNCQDYESKYNFYEIGLNADNSENVKDKKCVLNCGSKYSYNGRCYSKCPEGLYTSGNECVPNCNPNIFYENNEKSLICISSCPSTSIGDNNYKYLTSYGKCVKECPDGENYISRDNSHCLTNCGNDFFTKLAGTSGRNYDLYQCAENCGTKVYVNGTKECKTNCDDNTYLYESNTKKICYRTCISTDKPFSTVKSNTDSTKICDSACNGNNKYYGSNKICIPNCNHLIGNKTINASNNECVSQCDLNSNYKFLQEKDGEDANPYCQTQCDSNRGYNRYTMPNYKCVQECIEPNNFIVNSDSSNQIECQSKCPSGDQYAQYNLDKKEYSCTSEVCDQTSVYKYYYSDNKICLNECNANDYLKKDTNNCIRSCLSENLFYDEENKKCVSDCKDLENNKYRKINGYCAGSCDENEYYNEIDLICRVKCPNNQKIDDNNICRENCTTSENKKFENENGMCVEKCENSETGYIYYNIDFGNVCQNNCGQKLIKGNTCVSSCNENEINVESNTITKFVDNNMCLSSCPPNKNFIVYNPTTDGELTGSNSLQYQCLTDCPKNISYYSIITNSDTTVNACKNSCQAYITNRDPNINAKLCFDDIGCSGNNPYFILDNNNQKECLSKCPDDKPYYNSDNNENIECLDKCPNNNVTLPDAFACFPVGQCNTRKIRFKKRECVNDCSPKEKIFVNPVDNINYCIDTCNDLVNSYLEVPGLYLTYDDQCVSTCPENSVLNGSNICDCSNLFYIDTSNQKKKCLANGITECNEDYPIRVYNSNEITKECVKYCNGILSPSGYECYSEEYLCLSEYEKLVTLTNGDKICDCIDKYYYSTDNNEKKVKTCLKKGSQCSTTTTFKLLIKETNECVAQCKDPYKYKFESTCVSKCPSSTIPSENNENECTCKDKFYIDNNNNVICLEENSNCPNAYPLIIEGTSQCASSCIGTGNEYYFKKTCKESCGSDLSTVDDLKEDPYPTRYAQKKCRYKKNWYYDENTMEETPADSDSVNCLTLTNNKYKYTIIGTKQCVLSCPSNYPLVFDNYCLERCEDYTIQSIRMDSTNKKCICADYTEYEENNNSGNIKCLTYGNCIGDNKYSIVEDEKICYIKKDNKNCPDNYPFYFNRKCYKDCSTLANTKQDLYEKKCACLYKWYKVGEYDVKCLSKDENCPAEYPLIVASNKECKTENDLGLLEFNYTLYSSCPENTIPSGDTCICDPNKKWYKIQTEDSKLYFYCAKDKCPNDIGYLNFGEKQCLSSCDVDKVEFNGICYSDCPNLTEKGNDNKCVLSPVNNELTLDNVEKEIKKNILKLYQRSETDNNPITKSQKMDTKQATVEFYGVNKINKGNKQDNIKSDLSYIDISGCIDKIYRSNGMTSDADIIILKFDVKTPPSKYLINPVEYKFINSKTGQELDATICEHSSIKISYPLHDLISRYDNMKRNRGLEYMYIGLTSNNKDSLREKLDKGKEIKEKYPDIDIFNLDDKIYSDICIAVEVDGKDLILLDRINYFYPQMYICENNCTYNHTDFVNERIYCDCSFKQEFDFNRSYTSNAFEIDTERVNNDQGGNSNLAVLKCIPFLSYSKSLSGNGGFIFILIVIIVQVALFFIIILYGINSIFIKLNTKMNKEESEDHNENGNENEPDMEVLSVDNKIKNIDDKQDKETQRKLSAPPRKKKEYDMEFIPQEYLFLFFNSNERGVIKKIEKDSVPFKVGFNTRILLQKIKNVDYNNLKSRGPFPPNQNVLVIVDDINDEISDYIYDENEERIARKNSEQNYINNEDDEGSNNGKNRNKKGEKFSEKYNALKKYSRKINFTVSDYDPSDENYSKFDFDEDENHEKGFVDSIKREQRLLKKDYETAIKNQKSSNFVITLFTEILNKIYIINILLFTRKFDILTMQLSIYFLCHTILLIFLALFYDVKTIEKIWNTDDYPSMGYYLLYGFLSCIIVWIIYRIILCLWNNNDKIKEILLLIHAHDKYGVRNNRMFKKKCDNLSWKIKLKIAIYTIIQVLVLVFGFIYLVTFCAVYTGTQNKVFRSYGIALIEILIIKIIYGIVLAVLRKFSITKGIKTLYDIVLFMDTYIV